jgi:hypothetical protein
LVPTGMKDPTIMPRKNEYKAADRFLVQSSSDGSRLRSRSPPVGRSDVRRHRPDNNTTSAPDDGFMKGHVVVRPNRNNNRSLVAEEETRRPTTGYARCLMLDRLSIIEKNWGTHHQQTTTVTAASPDSSPAAAFGVDGITAEDVATAERVLNALCKLGTNDNGLATYTQPALRGILRKVLFGCLKLYQQQVYEREREKKLKRQKTTTESALPRRYIEKIEFRQGPHRSSQATQKAGARRRSQGHDDPRRPRRNNNNNDCVPNVPP